MNVDIEDLKALLTRPIAFHKLLAIAGGSVGSGVFLSQLTFWSERTTDPEGWVYKTAEDWWEETALSRFELDTIRGTLKKRGLIEEKRAGVPAKLYYRLDWEKLREALPEAARKHREGITKRLRKYPEKVPSKGDSKEPANKIAVIPQTGLREPRKQDCGNPADKSSGSSQTIIDHRVPSESTPERTTTTPRAHVSAKGMRLVAEEVREVVVVSSVVVEEEEEEPSKEEYWPDEDDSPVADQSPWPDDEAEEELPTVTEEQKTASVVVDAIVTEFGLGVVGRGEIQHHLGLKGLAYVQAKATLAKSAPRSNIGGYFLAALKNDWQPPKSTAPAPKRSGPTEPAGWREGLRAVARSCYPGADPEAWSYWKNVPRSLQVEVLAELARPTAASAPPVATVPAKVDLEAMREAVRNVGKEASA